MNAEELRGKSEDELTKLLLDKRKEQFNQRFQKSQGSLEKTADIRKTRRTIARIKTFLNAKNAPQAAKKASAKTAAPAKTAAKPTAEKKTTAKKAAPKKAAAKKKSA